MLIKFIKCCCIVERFNSTGTLKREDRIIGGAGSGNGSESTRYGSGHRHVFDSNNNFNKSKLR